MKVDCFKCKIPCVAGKPEEGPEVAGKRALDPDIRGWHGTAKDRLTHIPMICPRCGKTRGMRKQGF